MDAYIWSWAPGVAGQERYLKVAAALARIDPGWAVVRRGAHRPRSGASRRWLGLRRAETILWFDGHVLLARGRVDDGVAALVRCAPWLSAYPIRPLGPVEGSGDEALDALSVWTTAMLLLDGLADAVTGRPAATMAEIDRCAAWLRSPVRQHFMGRGVRERVLEPWRAYVSAVRRRLLAVSEYGATAVPEARARAPVPVAGLLDPLSLLTTSRDEALILGEYEDRLERLEQETGRAAAELGAVGTLAALALLPFESTLGPAFLLPVGAAAAIYYGGYALSRPRRTGASGPDRVEGHAPETVDVVVRTLLREPAAVLVGDGIGAAEFAAAAHLWLHLLQHHERDPASGAVAFGTEPALLAERGAVVMGGPLVQPREALGLRPACDLVGSSTYTDWRMETAAGRRLIGADRDETAALVSTAAGRDDVLLVVGFRDTGAVQAARWLGRSLLAPQGLPTAPWTLLRRDDGGFGPVVSGTSA